jgi:hypothetical protein
MPLAAVLDEPAHQGGGDRLPAHRLALFPQQDQALIRVQIIRAQRQRAAAAAGFSRVPDHPRGTMPPRRHHRVALPSASWAAVARDAAADPPGLLAVPARGG